MLGLGWTEMLLVGIVALVVIGPKELPGLMQKLGRFANQVKRMGSDFQRELNKTTGLDEVKNLRNAITQPLKATTDAIRKEFNTTTAAGAVTPSGALKPADPKVESVVGEIQKKAGIAAVPAAAGSAAVAMEPIKGAPVKAAAVTAPATDGSKPAPKRKRVAKAKAAPTSPVASTDLFPPETPAPAKKPRAKSKHVESPAPVEAIAPDTKAKPKPKRKRAPAKKAAS